MGDDAVRGRLHFGTERVETGHARLRKQVVTEQVQRTIPLTTRKVRIEREMIRPEDATAADVAEPLSEAETEVTLYEEQTVVTREKIRWSGCGCGSRTSPRKWW
ncbi:DUF2382 domain-containing protein [Streptacidiphilus sp. 4-A2]|nr:DUF2382 domain-containing protein [Streptacidiphilus sp. 4-A2]